MSLSPEREFKIHKLTVFELEVVFQLLDDHGVRLADLLLPLIFTHPSTGFNIITMNQMISIDYYDLCRYV